MNCASVIRSSCLVLVDIPGLVRIPSNHICRQESIIMNANIGDGADGMNR